MNLTRWDWVLYGVAAFVAVRALIRIMASRRDDMTAALEREREAALADKRKETARRAAEEATAEDMAELQQALANRGKAA